VPRHQKRRIPIPAWVDQEGDFCLQATAEDAYVAKTLAEDFGAPHSPSCAQLMRAGEKSLRIMADPRTGTRKRCAEGNRAAKKFLEAKVCVRKSS
jgi:hypothetical protein